MILTPKISMMLLPLCGVANVVKLLTQPFLGSVKYLLPSTLNPLSSKCIKYRHEFPPWLCAIKCTGDLGPHRQLGSMLKQAACLRRGGESA